jgi:hypothetical protein
VAEERTVDLQQLSKDWAQSVAHWAAPEISTRGSHELGGAQHQLKTDRGIATQVLRAGTNPNIVQERLGHPNASTTSGVYSHLTPTIQREAVERFGSWMTNSKSSLTISREDL